MNESLKTIKQIADIVGISKSTAYRFIKAESIHATSQDGSTLLYDESVEKLLSKHFRNNTESQNESSRLDKESLDYMNNELITTLKNQVETQIKQLDIKDSQIAELQKSNDQLQQLLLYEQQKNTKLLEENIDDRKWWQWRKKTHN